MYPVTRCFCIIKLFSFIYYNYYLYHDQYNNYNTSHSTINFIKTKNLHQTTHTTKSHLHQHPKTTQPQNCNKLISFTQPKQGRNIGDSRRLSRASAQPLSNIKDTSPIKAPLLPKKTSKTKKKSSSCCARMVRRVGSLSRRSSHASRHSKAINQVSSLDFIFASVSKNLYFWS